MAPYNDQGSQQAKGRIATGVLLAACLISAVASAVVLLGALTLIFGPMPTWIWTAAIAIELLASVLLFGMISVARR